MTRKVSIPTSLLVTIFFISIPSPVLAENLLGLPTPRDPRHPGTVMLFGGGSITTDAWERFIALAGGARARIVIVPSAGYRQSDYNDDAKMQTELARRFSAWVRLVKNGQAASVEFLYTDDYNDANKDEFVKPLKNATGVWFSGGLQSRLYYRYVGYHPEQTKFQIALREVIERGGIVGGTSAGMAALPEIMTFSQDNRSGPVTAVPAHGLGLFNGAIVEQHFNGRTGRLERFTGLLRNEELIDRLVGRPGASSKMIGLAVDEVTGLVCQGNNLEVVGNGNVHVFLKTQPATLTWHTLKSGTRAELKRERGVHLTVVK